MDLVLIKNKGKIKVYHGTLDYHEANHHFFATVVDGQIQDLVVHTLDEDQMKMTPVDEYTKGALFEILTEEYVQQSVPV